MANPEHLAKLKEGVEVWNQWRQENPATKVDLIHAILIDANLTGADLKGADLTGAYLSRADLKGADLTRANLRGATLFTARLSDATLTRADLRDAILNGAELHGATSIGRTSRRRAFPADVGVRPEGNIPTHSRTNFGEK